MKLIMTLAVEYLERPRLRTSKKACRHEAMAARTHTAVVRTRGKHGAISIPSQPIHTSHVALQDLSDGKLLHKDFWELQEPIARLQQ